MVLVLFSTRSEKACETRLSATTEQQKVAAETDVASTSVSKMTKAKQEDSGKASKSTTCFQFVLPLTDHGRPPAAAVSRRLGQ